jgi:alpha-L-fucosidase 2
MKKKEKKSAKRVVHSLVSSGLCMGLAGILLCTTPLLAAAETGLSSNQKTAAAGSAKRVVSDTYKDPQKGTLNWREAMVSGNGENGVMVSGHPVNDTFIFQNTKFNMPTNDYRDTRDMSGELEDARQAVMNNWQWQSSVQSYLEYDYTLHPGHQLRVKMDDLTEGDVENYQRWTDYETAEVGVQFTAKGETWTRSTFTSREDNVTVTCLNSSDSGSSINTTLSIDDLSDMAIDQDKEIDSGIQYKKLADEAGEYLGLVAHYPAYDNSELKNGGFAGITRVIAIGGNQERVNLGTIDDYLNAGQNENYGIRVTDAERLILITKSDRDMDMGTTGDFAQQTEYTLVDTLVEATGEVAKKTEYQTGGALDYEKILEPHKALHSREFNKVTFDLAGNEEDDGLTNEALLSKQRSSGTLNHAMLERAFYAGRYAQICASGYSTSRLSGMWMGAWNGYWQADYTTDANVNLQISGVNIGNLQNASEGYMNFLLRILPDFEDNAAKVYGMSDAIMAPPRTDGDRGNLVHFNQDYPFNYWNAGASWLLLPIYEYWQCYGNQQIPLGENIDLEALRSVLSVTDEDLSDAEIQQIKDRGYFDLEQDLLLPLLTKQANFWEQITDPRYYVGTDGYKHYDAGKTTLEEGERYLILPGYSPENTPGNTWIATSANSTMDIAAARSGLDMTIALEQKVKRAGYEEAVLKWEMLKEQLPEYMYDSDGALKEWALRDYAEQNNHRHVSHMYGVWPAHDTEDEKLVEGAEKALENRKNGNTGDDNASHGWLHQGLTEARLKNGEGVEVCLNKLLTGSHMYYSSMMTNHDRNRDSAYCTDALITIPAMILESLAYSDTGEIELLPALPEEWNSGSIQGMLSRSQAAINSLAWNLEEGTVKASITSNADQTLDVSCGVKISGAEIISGNGEVRREESAVRLELKANESAEIVFYTESFQDGTYEIKNGENSLDIVSMQENTEAVISTSSAKRVSQKWNAESTGMGLFTLTNVKSGKELDCVDNKLVHVMQGGQWQIQSVEGGYKLLTADGTQAVGVQDGKLCLTNADTAAVFLFDKKDNTEAQKAVGTIQITGGEAMQSGETLQLKAQVETEDGVRDDMEMSWSVKNKDGEAVITEDGRLTGEKAGSVVVQVFPKELPDNVQEQEIVIEEGMMEQDLLVGEVIGRTEGQWETQNPPSNAFDQNTETIYDGEDDGYAGIQLSGPFTLEGFRFVTRKDYDDRIIGTEIQGSNDQENWETICRIEETNTNPIYNGVNLDKADQAYTFYRISSGTSGYCNVAEVEFYGQAVNPADGLSNVLRAAEKTDKDKYEEAGVKRLEAAVEAAKAITEASTETEINKAKEAVSDALRSLRKAYFIYNYDTSVQTEGGWEKWEDDRQYSKVEMYTEEAGAVFSFAFEGTGFEMFSNKNPGLGYVQITVDGEVIADGEEVSLYDADGGGRQQQSIIKCMDLKYGGHTVEITLLDKKNLEGNGPKASLDAFRIFRDYEHGDEPEPEPEPSDIDAAALKLAIAMAEKMEKEQSEKGSYTVESWRPVQEALDSARAVLENPDAVQEDADNAFLLLISACSQLENSSQKVGLKAAIDGTEAVLSDTDSLSRYTKESVDAVRAALLEAQAVYNNDAADQGTINNATTKLLTAVTSLLTENSDTRLDILIGAAEAILTREAEYTPSSVEVLKAALTAAKGVADNSSASETELNEAYNSLAEAMTSLVRKANKEELKIALDKAEEILADSGRYVESSIAGLEAVTVESRAVYENQEADQNMTGDVLKKLIAEVLKARLLGDVNHDGAVDTQDASEVLAYSAEVYELTEEQLQAGDVNRDAVSDSGDAVVILQFAAEMINEFQQ